MKIIGHEDIIGRLKEMIKNDRVMPAYLFTGAEGIGKKLVAFHFAKMLNCAAEDAPCGSCGSCRGIDSGNASDVVFLTLLPDKASIGIEQSQELKRLGSLKPFGSRRKIFIIDRADDMTTEAGNAFLKILEDAEPSNVFILISSRPQNVLDTIKSRASLVRFAAFPGERIAGILESEPYSRDKKEARFIAGLAAGSLGAALDMAKNDVIKKKNEIIDMTNRLLYNGGPSISNEAWKFEDRRELREAIAFMVTWLRDIYVVKSGSGGGHIHNIDRAGDIDGVSACAGVDAFEEMIGRLMLYDSYIDNNVNHKIITDAIVCDLMSMSQ